MFGTTKRQDKTSQDVLSMMYIKILRGFLLTVGAWSDEYFGKKTPMFFKIQRKTYPIQLSIIIAGSTYFLFLYRSTLDFLVTSRILINMTISIVSIVRVACMNFKEYDVMIRDFINNFHLNNYKHKNGHYKMIGELTDKLSHRLMLLHVAEGLAGPILFNFIPLYTDYTLGAFTFPRNMNNTYDYSIFYAYPGFRQADHFYITTAINIYLSYMCAIIVTIVDLLLCLMVFQIVGHIKTLLIDIETMKRPLVTPELTNDFESMNIFGFKEMAEIFDTEENKAVAYQLKEIIRHHRIIVSFADRISLLFGPQIALNYMFSLVVGCLVLVEFSDMDANKLVRFGILALVVFVELIEISVIFEVVGSASEKIINSLYGCPWEGMDVRNRRTVALMLLRIQKPIRLTAIGMIPVGVNTMAKVFKGIISYAMLQSLHGQ